VGGAERYGLTEAIAASKYGVPPSQLIKEVHRTLSAHSCAVALIEGDGGEATQLAYAPCSTEEDARVLAAVVAATTATAERTYGKLCGCVRTW